MAADPKHWFERVDVPLRPVNVCMGQKLPSVDPAKHTAPDQGGV